MPQEEYKKLIAEKLKEAVRWINANSPSIDDNGPTDRQIDEIVGIGVDLIVLIKGVVTS